MQRGFQSLGKQVDQLRRLGQAQDVEQTSWAEEAQASWDAEVGGGLGWGGPSKLREKPRRWGCGTPAPSLGGLGDNSQCPQPLKDVGTHRKIPTEARPTPTEARPT